METIEEFEKLLKEKNATCRWDKTPLGNEEIKHYPHAHGVVMGGERVWAYVQCPKCNYMWSFEKLQHYFGGE